MKKILLLFTALGALTLSSCSNDDDVRSDTVASVVETPALTFTSAGDYQILVEFDQTYPQYDSALVYRRIFDSSANVNAWQLIPRTIFLDNGDEVDYDYNFTQSDLILLLGANFPLNEIPADLTTNQVFRIVMIPGSLNGQAKAAKVDFKDYNAVIKHYGINDSNVKVLK
jgi:hypothetical protein